MSRLPRVLTILYAALSVALALPALASAATGSTERVSGRSRPNAPASASFTGLNGSLYSRSNVLHATWPAVSNEQGGVGNDVLHGDAGNDTIICGAGTDKAFGDAGNDKLNCVDHKGGDAINGGAGKDICTGDKKDKFIGCEKIIRK